MLRLWLATLVMTAACRSDPCPPAQAAAAQAVSDYARRTWDSAPTRDPLRDAKELNKRQEHISSIRQRVTCGPIRRMIAGPQPAPELVTELLLDASTLVTHGSIALRLEGLDPALVTRLTAADEAFNAVFARFDAEVPRAALREKRPWPLASLTYLNSLREVWCEWAGAQLEAFAAHEGDLDRRYDVFMAEVEEDLAANRKIMDRAIPAQDLAAQLETSTHRVPVDVPRVLDEDPAFARALSLVRVVDDACRP